MLAGVAKWVTVGVRVDDSQLAVGLKRAANDVERGAQGMGTSMVAAGVRMAAGLGAAVVAAGALERALSGTIAVGSEFEQSMNTIGAITSANAVDLAKAEKAIRRVSLEWGTGTKSAGDAAKELLKAGVAIEDLAGGALDAAVVMAKATGGTYADGATIAAKATQVFKLEASDMGRVVQGAAGVISATSFELSDYNLALQQAGSAAQSAGLKLEDFNALLALSARALGTSGSDTGTAARTFLSRLVPQSQEAADAMKALGLQFYDANGKFVGLAETAERLKRSLKGLSDEQRNLALVTIFGVDAQRQAIALMDEGAAGVVKYRDEVVNAADAGKMAKAQTDGFAGATANLAAAFDDLGVSIAKSGLLDALAALTDYAAGGVRGLSVGVQALKKDGFFGAIDPPALKALANEGYTLARKNLGYREAWHMSANERIDYASKNADPRAFLAKLEAKDKNGKSLADSYVGSQLADLFRTTIRDSLPKRDGYSRGGSPADAAAAAASITLPDLSRLSDVTIKKLEGSIKNSNLELAIPDELVASVATMRVEAEGMVRTAQALEEAMRPFEQLVEGIKSELEYAIINNDWSSVGDAFSYTLKKVIYEAMFKDVVDAFGDLVRQLIFGVLNAIDNSAIGTGKGGIESSIGAISNGLDFLGKAATGSLSSSPAVAGAGNVTINMDAKDAVLSSTVKGWIAQGVSQGVQVSRGLSASDATRRSSQKFGGE